MFYRKNLYAWEQIVRIAAGLTGVAAAFAYLPDGWMLVGAVASGAGLALTGVFGFCPACAMIGRKPVTPTSPAG